MKRLSVIQLGKDIFAFAAVSGLGVDLSLLLAGRLGWDVPGAWFINGPLLIWSAAAVPASIMLLERVWSHVRPGPAVGISGRLEGASAVVRSIPFNTNAQAGRLLASTMPAMGSGADLEPGEVYRPAAWRVTKDGLTVTVRESELRAFLEAAAKRTSHQFSRPYWTRRRRPPLWRGQYEAYMLLLSSAGLVEGRQDGASGRLVTLPRHAITYLKHESQYRVT